MSEIDAFDELLQSATEESDASLQVTEGGRDLPIARGWGTGGLQVTLALVEPRDVVKVIDQGDDDENRYMMDTTPIPRYDVPSFNMTERLSLFGAGREKRVYAVPPYTHVVPLEFEDYRFKTEHNPALHCEKCGSNDTYLTSQYLEPERPGAAGRWAYYCSDSSFCLKRVQKDRHISMRQLP